MAAATELNGTGYVRFVQPDVTSQANVDAAAEQVAKDFGHLDAMVNNAGVNTLTRRHLDHLPKPTEETADDLRFVYEVNVFAVVRVTNAFLPLLQRAPAGRIVNVTSKRGSTGGAWERLRLPVSAAGVGCCPEVARRIGRRVSGGLCGR